MMTSENENEPQATVLHEREVERIPLMTADQITKIVIRNKTRQIQSLERGLQIMHKFLTRRLEECVQQEVVWTNNDEDAEINPETQQRNLMVSLETKHVEMERVWNAYLEAHTSITGYRSSLKELTKNCEITPSMRQVLEQGYHIVCPGPIEKDYELVLPVELEFGGNNTLVRVWTDAKRMATRIIMFDQFDFSSGVQNETREIYATPLFKVRFLDDCPKWMNNPDFLSKLRWHRTGWFDKEIQIEKKVAETHPVLKKVPTTAYHLPGYDYAYGAEPDLEKPGVYDARVAVLDRLEVPIVVKTVVYLLQGVTADPA